jgi:hypothetical protein
MRQTKYKNKLRRKSIKKKNKLRRKTIKNRKQVGGQLSDNCTREIISLAFGDTNNNLTQEQINILTNKTMTLAAYWRANFQNLFSLLEQMRELNNLTYDETNDWIDDIINMWQQEQQ